MGRPPQCNCCADASACPPHPGSSPLNTPDGTNFVILSREHLPNPALSVIEDPELTVHALYGPVTSHSVTITDELDAGIPVKRVTVEFTEPVGKRYNYRIGLNPGFSYHDTNRFRLGQHVTSAFQMITAGGYPNADAAAAAGEDFHTDFAFVRTYGSLIDLDGWPINAPKQPGSSATADVRRGPGISTDCFATATGDYYEQPIYSCQAVPLDRNPGITGSGTYRPGFYIEISEPFSTVRPVPSGKTRKISFLLSDFSQEVRQSDMSAPNSVHMGAFPNPGHGAFSAKSRAWLDTASVFDVTLDITHTALPGEWPAVGTYSGTLTHTYAPHYGARPYQCLVDNQSIFAYHGQIENFFLTIMTAGTPDIEHFDAGPGFNSLFYLAYESPPGTPKYHLPTLSHLSSKTPYAAAPTWLSGDKLEFVNRITAQPYGTVGTLTVSEQ